MKYIARYQGGIYEEITADTLEDAESMAAPYVNIDQWRNGDYYSDTRDLIEVTEY